MKNNNCDNDKCLHPNGQIRVLPTGGSGNALLCRACFNHEMHYRKIRNIDLGDAYKFKIETWENLRVYETD